MKTVCITANDDGTYTVEIENESAQMPDPEVGPENGTQDMQEDAAEGEAGQTVSDISQALALAEQMLQGSTAEPKIEGEDEFVQGFAQARGM
jgi:hypothetical protein